MASSSESASSKTITHVLKYNEISNVEIVIKSLKANDYYATNLNLTGLAIWFGAYNMSDFAQANLAHFVGKNVLELGAGIGLCGIAISKLIQTHNNEQSKSSMSDSGEISGGCCRNSIVLTDGEEELIPMLAENCETNGLSSMVTCSQLWWGAGPTLDALCEKYPHGFDSIVGADLLYSKDQVAVLPLLFHTVNTLLHKSNPEAAFYLAVTRRNFDIVDLLKEASKNGLKWTVDEGTIYDIFDNNIDEQTVFWRDAIYIFTRRADGDIIQDFSVVTAFDDDDENN
jgi:hypothetical protein